METKEPFITICYLDDQFQANLLCLELDKKQIPYYLQSFYDEAYQNIFQLQKGWGKLEAPASCQAEILEILAELPQNVKNDFSLEEQ